MRKPDPEIYRYACDRMQVAPSEVLYLDDLGVNLKPAKALGMQTIKVVSEEQAIADLSRILGRAF
jgi:putative hydrolase of the HAD superfamily